MRQIINARVAGLRGPGLTPEMESKVDDAIARAIALGGALADVPSFWRGKDIVVAGDSLWKDYGINGTNGIPYQACQLLGAKVHNVSVIAAMARNGDHLRRTATDPYGWTGINWGFIAFSLSATLAEKDELIANWSSKWRELLTGDDRPAALSAELQSAIRASSWELSLKPFIDAGTASLYLLPLGYNDEQAIGGITAELADDQDRGTYIGAMSYLAGKIYAGNRHNQIAIPGHYEDQLRPAIAKAQSMVAAKLGIPLLRTWEQVAFSQFKPNGTATMLDLILGQDGGDGYHPHNDPSGFAVPKLARCLADWLRGGLPASGSGIPSVRDATPGDLLAFSVATPFTPMMALCFYDEEDDWGFGKVLYLPLGQGIYNISAGAVALTSLAGASAPGLLTHTGVLLPHDGQAYVAYSRYDTNSAGVARYDNIRALAKAYPGQITELATDWGAIASARLPMMRLRDAYAPNMLQGGQIMAGPMIREFYADAGSTHVKITDPILTAMGHTYGFASAVNGRAAAGGYFPNVPVKDRLCTIRWKARSSADNKPGNPPVIFLWDGSDLEQLIETGIVVEQRLSAKITVYRWTGYLPDIALSHIFVSNDMGGTDASVTISGVQVGFGMDVRRDDFAVDKAPNLFANGRDMEGAGVLIYPGNGTHVDVAVPELKALGFTRGILGPVGGRADAGGYFPTDRPVSGRVFTWRVALGTTGASTWGLPLVIYLWDGDTFLSAERLDSQMLIERELSNQARIYRCTARIPETITPTHYYISSDQNGSLAQSLITGVQLAEGLDIDPDDFPIDPEADPAMLAARDAANLQRAALFRTRTVTRFQTPTALYNILILDGQSLGSGQETYPPRSTSQYGSNLTLGSAPFPAAYGGTTYPVFGAATLQPLVAVTVDDTHVTLLPAKVFNFTSTVEGFTCGNGSLAVSGGVMLITASAGDPQLFTPVIARRGRDIRYIRVRARPKAASPTFEGIIYYSTPNHGISAGFSKTISNPGIATDVWVVLEWDMAALTVGGTDYIDSQVNQMRFDITNAIQNWEIDWISLSNTPVDGGVTGVSDLPAGSGAFGEPPSIGWTNDAKYRLNQMLLSEDDTTRKFVSINGAVSGQGIATYLKPSGSNYGRTKDGVSKVKTAAGVSACVVTGLLWMQGEYDYLQMSGGVNRKATYKASLNKKFDDDSTDYMAITGQTKPFLKLVYQSGSTFTVDNDADGRPALAIGMAQLEVALERSDCVMVGPTYFTTDKGGHLDSNGSRWFGAMAAKVHHRVVIEEQRWEPLRPIRIEQVGRVVYVDFHVPYAPLQWAQPYVGNTAVDIADRGFRITDDLGAVPISRIDFAGQTIVGITLGRATVGQVYLWYAHQAAGGAGMLRDSDPSLSRDLYEYTAGSGDYASANIPALVNKPYPLQNWCVAFFYPVGFGVAA